MQHFPHLLLDPEFASVEPFTPLVPITARTTLHHSSAKTTSSCPLTRPLGCAEPKGGSLAAPCCTHLPLCQPNAVHIITDQELTWAPHSLMGHLATPRGLWRGHVAPTPPQQLWDQGSCLADHTLHRFCLTFSLWCCMVTIWETAGHGQEFVLDTDSPSVRGREKINFQEFLWMYYLEGGMLRN